MRVFPSQLHRKESVLQYASIHTVEARKLEYDCPPTPYPREEGKPAQIAVGPYSNFLGSTVSKYQHPVEIAESLYQTCTKNREQRQPELYRLKATTKETALNTSPSFKRTRAQSKAGLGLFGSIGFPEITRIQATEKIPNLWKQPFGAPGSMESVPPVMSAAFSSSS